MQVRPHTKALFMLKKRRDTLFNRIPIDVIHLINALANPHYVIDDVESLFPFFSKEHHQKLMKDHGGKKLYLAMEANGKNEVGEIIMSGGATLATLPVRAMIHYMYLQNIDPDTKLPKTEINRLLYYIAFGQPDVACQMLRANPALLDQSGYVIAPTGDLIWDVKPFECAFSMGDHYPDMIPRLAAFLPYVENGEAVYQAQHAKYKNDLASIGKEEPYAFRWVMEFVKQSSKDDEDAFLKQEFKRDSELQRNVNQFWHDFPMRIITRGLVCPYATIHAGYQMLANEANDLYKRAGNSYRKIKVFWLLQNWIVNRRLPDRQAFARGYLPAHENDGNVNLERSVEFLQNPGHFFNACEDFLLADDRDSVVGCGRSFGIDLYGGAGRWRGGFRHRLWGPLVMAAPRAFGKLMSSKNTILSMWTTYAAARQPSQQDARVRNLLNCN